MVLVSPVDFGLLVLDKVQPSTSTVIRCMVAYSTRDRYRYRLLKIAGFETRIVFLPREVGPLVGGYSSTSIGVVVLRLRTTDGIEGIGYASFTPRNITSALKEVVDALAEDTIGQDPLRVEAISTTLLEDGGSGAPAGLVTRAVAAIDVALWDIKGKLLGQPVYKLLGGYSNRVPTYASGKLWRPYSLKELAGAARGFVDEGFNAMKLRMGAEDSESKELDRYKVVRDAVGPDVDIMIDINQSWDLNTVFSIGPKLDERPVYWLEDPVYHQDIDGLARIAGMLQTPIAAGEYHYGIEPFRSMLEKRSIDIVMVDLMRAGGLTQWMKIAYLAEAFNLPIVSHLATEILIHAVAAVPNGLTVEYMPWTFALFKEVPIVDRGYLDLPETPGLGLELDEASIDRFGV